MEQNGKKWIQRIVSGAFALFFFAFGITWKKHDFCLGDMILEAVGLPAWSKETQGLHYPAIIAVAGIVVSFHFFSATTKNPEKTGKNLFYGSIGLLVVLGFLLSMFKGR